MNIISKILCAIAVAGYLTAVDTSFVPPERIRKNSILNSVRSNSEPLRNRFAQVSLKENITNAPVMDFSQIKSPENSSTGGLPKLETIQQNSLNLTDSKSIPEKFDSNLITTANTAEGSKIEQKKQQVDAKTFALKDGLPKLAQAQDVFDDKSSTLAKSELNSEKNETLKEPINDDMSMIESRSNNFDTNQVQDVNIKTLLDSNKHLNVESKNYLAEQSAIMQQVDVPLKNEHHEHGILYQSSGFIDDNSAPITFNFEEASLINLLVYIEVVHNVKFITEDIIIGAKDAKGAAVPSMGVVGHKITFRTNRNLTRKESWDLFLTFMNIAGLDVVPMAQDRFYRIVPLTKAHNEPIPTYIGVDSSVLPDSDMIVRYVYFARNVDPEKIKPLLKNMQGQSAKLDVYTDLRGLIFTDRACAIKSLMHIVTELDKGALPEAMSVVKLQRANVDDVIKLYQSLKPANPTGAQPQKVWMPQKKESSVDYFPADVSLVGDKRTNSLIILGVAKDVQRIEEFVTKYIDISVDRSAPPVFTYKLQYTNASNIAQVLNKIVMYGASTPAGQYGGVRDGIKFFQTMNIVPDSFTNSLIINATQEDYQALIPLIKDLDIPQKQVGIEVLIVQVKDADVKTLGAQISGPNGINSPVVGAGVYGPTFAQSASAQTSGISPGTPIVVTGGQAGQDDFSIKSSLASLLGGNVLNEIGSVLVTFGRPIWAIFKILKTITSTHVIANPFLVVTNNSTAQITSGEERRQISGEVVSSLGQTSRGFTPVEATLQVQITPQINKGNIINLNIFIQNSLFTQSDASAITPGSGGSPRDQKTIQTTVSVANGETLVLGGIMSESYATSSAGVPFLEQIPVVGWFFKSKTRKVNRDHFMIFVCPRLLDPVNDESSVDHYSTYKLQEVQQHLDLIDESDWFASQKDPIQKAFFGSQNSPSLQQLHIGNTFKNREKLDGKIDDLDDRNSKRVERKTHNKKNKKKKVLKNIEPVVDTVAEKDLAIKKNSISHSINSTAKVAA